MVCIALFKGYGASPGNIKYAGDLYDSVLKPIYDLNDEPLVSANEFEQGARHGGMYELHWFSEEGPQFEIIPFDQGIPLWSNDIRPKLLGFIWYRKIGESEYADYLDKDFIYRYEKIKGTWTALPEEKHGYRTVPVNCGPFQAEWKNLFDHALTLIDLKDKLLSQDVANEGERFNAAILVLKKRLSNAPDESGLTDADKVKMWKILDGSEDPANEAAFITRDIPTDFIEMALKVVNEDITKALQIIDAYDENFAGASGEAQKWRLLPMMYRFNSIKPYFLKFLQNRAKMICGHILVNVPFEGLDITIQADLPINQADIIRSAVELSTLTSKETALAYLPANILPNGVKAEMKLVKKSAPSTGLTLDDVDDEEDTQE